MGGRGGGCDDVRKRVCERKDGEKKSAAANFVGVSVCACLEKTVM